MDVADLRGRTAVVTGAGSGIGRACALALAQRGAGLAICDVNDAGLAETATAAEKRGVPVLAQHVDVASADAMQAFAAAVHARVRAVDVLVNNAGVGLGGGLLESSLEDWRWIVDINLFGVVHGCHFFVPAMVRSGRGGHVVNVASMAGYCATSMMPAYTATKFAVVGFSESLREELAPHGIGVTAVCPGVIDTGIVQASRLRGAHGTDAARADMQRSFTRRGYGPERVAARIVRAIERDEAVVPVTPEAWELYLLKRVSPALTSLLSRTIEKRTQGG